MRSERRHELQQNELADWMANIISTIKPYANAILAAVLLVVIVAVAATLWIQKSRAQETAAWDVFYSAMEAASNRGAALAEVSEQYPGTQAAQWAVLLGGETYLSSGCQERFRSKATANQELGKAVECYQVLLDGEANPTIRERATFGLARARETLGELDQARELYQKVVQQWPEGPYATASQRRLADLDRPATKTFFDQFAQYDPKPTYSGDQGLPGGRLPFDDSSLPGAGEDLLKSLDSSGLPPSDSPKTFPSTGTEDSTPAQPATETAPKEDAVKLPIEPPKSDAAAPAAEPPKESPASPAADAPAPADPSTPATPPTPEEEKKPESK